jgi:hypothetical protein
MPEAAAAKKPHAEATKFTLVAHHKECTTPNFYLDAERKHQEQKHRHMSYC